MSARLALALTLAASAQADAPKTPEGPPRSAQSIREAHARALIRDLDDYTTRNRKAVDLDEAYLILFETAIEHEMYAESQGGARRYLTEHPEGTNRSLAHVITSLGLAHAGRFPEALADFQELLRGLDSAEQAGFAAELAENLVNRACTANQIGIARQIDEALLGRFREAPELQEKIHADLARLDLVGRPAPRIVAEDLYGAIFRLSDLRGKVVLVNFWATWCAPCLAELPEIQKVYARYHPRGFEVVAVSLDESKQDVLDFVRTRKLPGRQLHNATGGADVFATFGISDLPASYLIGPDGSVVRLAVRGADLDAILSKMLGTKP